MSRLQARFLLPRLSAVDPLFRIGGWRRIVNSLHVRAHHGGFRGALDKPGLSWPDIREPVLFSPNLTLPGGAP